jgi:thiamine kinase-like enzyme
MRFIEGRTLTEQEVREPQNLERIMHLIQTCHTEIPKHFEGPALIFWPFHVCRSYIITARDGNSSMMDSLQRFVDINEELEKTVGEIKLVFGHNDLLAANFIDDGKRLWLLDWDYAGYNAAIFDLANLSSNNELSPEQEDWLMETYYQQPVTDRLRHRLEAMKCASLLRETLWSIVSEIHSTIEFDYASYTKKNLTRFESAYEAFQQMR